MVYVVRHTEPFCLDVQSSRSTLYPQTVSRWQLCVLAIATGCVTADAFNLGGTRLACGRKEISQPAPNRLLLSASRRHREVLYSTRLLNSPYTKEHYLFARTSVVHQSSC